MNQVGLFQKVGFSRFYSDCRSVLPALDEKEAAGYYERIVLPRRMRREGVDYTVFAPVDVTFRPGEPLAVPTGLFALLRDEWCLVFTGTARGKGLLSVAGGLRTFGGAPRRRETEGHIVLPLFCFSPDGAPVTVRAGEPLCRALFLPFGTAFGENAGAA